MNDAMLTTRWLKYKNNFNLKGYAIWQLYKKGGFPSFDPCWLDLLVVNYILLIHNSLTV